MQGKKVLFLFLALLLPVTIFVFLKMFGKNEFDIAPLHQDGKTAPEDCEADYQFPYVLPDTVMTAFASRGRDSLYLISVSDNISSRIKQEVNYPGVKIVTPEDAPDLQDARFRKCILLVPADEDLIVVDNSARIRGYYSSDDREEVDRLFLELKILLKKY